MTYYLLMWRGYLAAWLMSQVFIKVLGSKNKVNLTCYRLFNLTSKLPLTFHTFEEFKDFPCACCALKVTVFSGCPLTP